MNEDIFSLESMRNVRSSPAYNGGNFSPMIDASTLMLDRLVKYSLTK